MCSRDHDFFRGEISMYCTPTYCANEFLYLRIIFWHLLGQAFQRVQSETWHNQPVVCSIYSVTMAPGYHCEISKFCGLFSKSQLNKKWIWQVKSIWTWKGLEFITPMVKEVMDKRHLNNWKCFILLKCYFS